MVYLSAETTRQKRFSCWMLAPQVHVGPAPAPAGCYRARNPVVLFPSIDLVRIEFFGKHFESSDRELVVPCECRRALENQETTPGRCAMLCGIELPVLFAMFFVFKFPFFLSGFLCKTGVGSSSPLPECFQKIEKNFFTI